MEEIKKEVLKNEEKTWHEKHTESMSFGDRIADGVASGMGSWRFIIIQTFIVLLWMVFNIVAFINHWDPYPFILLNLLLSYSTFLLLLLLLLSELIHFLNSFHSFLLPSAHPFFLN